MITNMKKLIGGNSRVDVHATDYRLDFSIHGIRGIVLSPPEDVGDDIYGSQFVRALYITQEVEVSGRTEIRRVQVSLFADERGSLKMNQGFIVEASRKEREIKREIEKGNKEGS